MYQVVDINHLENKTNIIATYNYLIIAKLVCYLNPNFDIKIIKS